MTAIVIKLVETHANVDFFEKVPEARSFAEKNNAALILRQEDLTEAFKGKTLVTVYNSIIAQLDDFGAKTALDTTKRFSSADAGAKRTVKALAELQEAVASPESVEETAPDAEPEQTQSASPRPTPVAAQPTSGDRKPRKLKDKRQEPGPQAYPFKFGNIGETALGLISRPGGVHVDEFIEVMNQTSPKGGWTRGNAWSSLRYILHTNKGWGMEMKDEVITVIEPKGSK